MSGMWKRGHASTIEAPPDERGGNGRVGATITASHFDSTGSVGTLRAHWHDGGLPMTDRDAYAERLIARFRGSAWTLKAWQASPALFAKDGGPSTKFHGQSFDAAKYELIEDGWSHDHCPFCWVTICDDPVPEYVSEAYTNGYDWVCPDCYAKYLEPKT